VKLAFLFGGEVMKKAGRCIVLIFMVLVLVAPWYSSVFAQDNKYTRETLRGLQGIEVLIESLKPEIRQRGLTEDQLRTDTELKLRMAGIKVLSHKEKLSTPGNPYLYVNANIISVAHTYVFNIVVEFRQDAFLIRVPNIRTFGGVPTWYVGEVGINPRLEEIRAVTKDLVDRFINAYLSVNPK